MPTLFFPPFSPFPFLLFLLQGQVGRLSSRCAKGPSRLLHGNVHALCLFFPSIFSFLPFGGRLFFFLWCLPLFFFFLFWKPFGGMRAGGHRSPDCRDFSRPFGKRPFASGLFSSCCISLPRSTVLDDWRETKRTPSCFWCVSCWRSSARGALWGDRYRGAHAEKRATTHRLFGRVEFPGLSAKKEKRRGTVKKKERKA